VSDFNWNKKRSVQRMTTNRVIETVSLSPKEVIVGGGNRVQQDQVIASLCAAVMELISLQEESAARIDSIYQKVGAPENDRVRIQSEDAESDGRDA